MVVSISPVELTRGELRVVGEIDTLITELTTDLVDTVEASDDKLLEVKFRSDTHEHVNRKVVMEGLERFGGGTTGGHVKDRSLHLNESHVVEEGANILDHTGAGHEDITVGGVEDEVEVTLTVTRLLVGECPWHHVKTWGEELHAGREDRELTLLGLTRETLDSDNVTTLDEGKLVVERLLVAGESGEGVIGTVELLEVAHHLHRAMLQISFKW